MLLRRNQSERRRASVLVMVVGILAMLFIIGSTLLIVSRFERQTVDAKRQATQRGDGTNSLIDSILRLLRLEVVGHDGVAYNAGWHQPGATGGGDVFIGEKFATFAGAPADPAPNAADGALSAAQLVQRIQNRYRGGNLLLASSEPFDDLNGNWIYRHTSWDQLFAPAGPPPVSLLNVPDSLATPPRWGLPELSGSGDADGDGVPDAHELAERDFSTFLRIVSNGGMVRLDPATHAALLAQVIHPSDLPPTILSQTTLEARSRMLQQFIGTLAINPAEQEARLRRRGLLPANLSPAERAALPANDIRRALPFTLGYDSNAPFAPGTGLTPHWQQVNPQERTGDENWWKSQMNRAVSGLPPLAMSDPNYDPARDVYSRRPLVTTESADNLLRPQRDERRLSEFRDSPVASYLDLVAPQNNATSPLVYGTLPQAVAAGSPTSPNWVLDFNTQQARTQMSLRDVLSDWLREDAAAGMALADANGRPIPAAGLTYRRVQQLTAYYLAMIQHTTASGDRKRVATDPADTATLKSQLESAAQLAVNTIDFADAGIPFAIGGTLPAWVTVTPAGSFPTDDPPTRIRWAQAAGKDNAGLDIPGTGFSIDVTGVERHPYITEAYVRHEQKPKESSPGVLVSPPEWDEPDHLTQSIYAVELYNPYDVPLDLNRYLIRPGNVSINATIPPFSYVVVANRFSAGDWLQSNLITPVQDTNVFVSAALIITDGAAVELVRKDVLEVTATGLTYDAAANVVVDRLAPMTGTGDPLAAIVNAAAWAYPGKPTEPAPVTDNKYLYTFPDEDPARPYTAGTCPNVDAVHGSTPPYYVRRPGQVLENGQPNGVAPASDRLVRDYSLQRHKEFPGVPPIHWHATLGRQIQFPMSPEFQYPAAPPCVATVSDDISAPVHHNLLFSGYDTTTQTWQAGRGWQSVVAQEFKGFAVNTTTNQTGTPTTLQAVPPKWPIAGVPVVSARALPESSRPHAAGYQNTWTFDFRATSGVRIVFNAATLPPGLGITDQQGGAPSGSTTVGGLAAVDLGATTGPPLVTGIRVSYTGAAAGPGFRIVQVLDAVTGQPVQPLAFPTTGSLLLVSRYANSADRPASQAAASLPPDGGVLVELDPTKRLGVLQRVDNGHLPLWDDQQTCSDLANYPSSHPNYAQIPWPTPQGAMNVPWGQQVYNYFTTLPIEELYHYRNLRAVTPATLFDFAAYQSVRLVDLDPQRYQLAYRALFPGIPMVEPVPGPSGPLVGPRVRGRININTAPWWVLDGLPLLPWNAQGSTLSSVPVPSTEIVPVWTDPQGVFGPYARLDGSLAAPYDRLPGMMIAIESADENAEIRTTLDNQFGWATRRVAPPLDLPSVSPAWARGMVAYRDRLTGGFHGVSVVNPPADPGFLSVGQLGEVLARLNLTVNAPTAGGFNNMSNAPIAYLSPTGLVPGFREYNYIDSAVEYRPYAYLGYLQLVAPLVRLEDWATVKDHVFTIYVTQGDQSTSPPVWTHAELTVDRTRCLYTSDLPAIVARTPPVNYYNVVDDQK